MDRSGLSSPTWMWDVGAVKFASIRSTFLLCSCARVVARFVATVVFPTPPLIARMENTRPCFIC